MSEKNNKQQHTQISKLMSSRIKLAYLLAFCIFVKLLRSFGSIRHVVAGARVPSCERFEEEGEMYLK